MCIKVKCTDAIFVNESNTNDKEENSDEPESEERVQGRENSSQREQEDDFKVEDKVQDADNVIKDFEFHSSISNRFKATFISRQFIKIRSISSERDKKISDIHDSNKQKNNKAKDVNTHRK